MSSIESGSKLLCVKDALSGESMKNPHYQARRIMAGLDPVSGEYVNMAAAVDFALKAESLHNHFFNLPPKQRQDMLEEVLSNEPPENIPWTFKEKLLVQGVRDKLVKLNASNIAEWVDMIQPRASVDGEQGLSLARKVS